VAAATAPSSPSAPAPVAIPVAVTAAAQPRHDITGLTSALAAQIPEEDGPLHPVVPASAAPLSAADAEDDAQFSARIVAILPPETPAVEVPGLISATVAGTTLSGHPILESPEGGLVVDQLASLPQGTRILIQRVDPAAIDTVRDSAIPPAPLDPVAGKSWPALAAALPALVQAQPALADAVQMAIPQAGPLLAPIMLLFVAALRRGDVKDWLGDAPLSALRHAGQPALASALGSDFARAAHQSAAAIDDGWHTMPIPIFAEGELSRLQLHLRRYKPSDDGNDETPGENERSGGEVRFLIDAEPSATGPLQLDGLVRKARPGQRAALDLIIRSYRPIAPETRSDIALIFSESLATSGLAGGLSFQGGADWIKIAGERAQAPSVMA
jgi:hypothetical protein